MARLSSRESILLLLGDTAVFGLSLWLALFLRHGEVPSSELLATHIPPFVILFFVWVLVFAIAGLYERRSLLLRREQTRVIGIAHACNIVLAALFFFSIPYFGITPKTTLFIYLLVSSVLLLLWRLYVSHFVGVRRSKNALLLGTGDEVEELHRAITGYPQYGLRILHAFSPDDIVRSDSLQDEVLEYVTKKHIDIIIADVHHPRMKDLLPIVYNLSFLHNKVSFVDTAQLYEDIFNRVPISLLNEEWFLRHITTHARPMYDLWHRAFDIVGSILLGIPTLLLLPFVAFLIKREDGGPVFTYQERVGQYNTPLRLIKFRTMTTNDGGKWGSVENRITRIGKVLRKTRIDELPQLWNVLRGDYSLIGPRPEFPPAVSAYAEAIPHYNARHLVRPGLSGWAQIYHELHPHHGVDVVETARKLSYDLYYVKHRSVLLDLVIALRTIHTLLSRKGV